jgi:hypothetical protein
LKGVTMKKFLKILLVVVVVMVLHPFMQQQLQAQLTQNDVIINEFVPNISVGKEYVELLVVKSGGVDLRGCRLSDVGSKGGAVSTTEGHLDFPNESYLSNLQRGTRIICVLTTPSTNSVQFVQDTDPSDSLLILFSSGLPSGVLVASGTMDLSTNENIELLTDSTSTATTIDFVGVGSNTSATNFPDAVWVQTGAPTSSSGSVQYFRNSSGCGLNNDTAAVGWQWNKPITEETPGQKNVGQNFPWIPPQDGDGTASLANTGGGTLNNSTIFPRNSSGQTITVSISGNECGTLDKVRLTVPGTWSTYNTANVSVGGAFAGKTPSFSGNDINLTGLSLGSTPGTITITGLTTPNPVGAGISGEDTWVVKTATVSGTLTDIASSPKSHTIIPISNIRTGGTDGYGNSDAEGNISAMEGQGVAIAGVATIENGILNTTSFTSFFIQSGGYGMQIFTGGTPPSFSRGDSIIVIGTVTSYNGGMEVIPATPTSPNLFVVGPGTLPTPIDILDATYINEQHEGKLVRLSTAATFDSAGQSFIASDINRGMNNFRTAPNDTGTLFLHAANTNVVGKTIPPSANIVGIVHQRNDIIGAGQTKRKLAVRDLVDLGYGAADGSGTATISPTSQASGATSVTETIVLKGNGVYTIEGMSVTIPSTWTWTGNPAHAAISGPGFTSASKSVTGTGSAGDPWVITLSSTAVTNVDTGIIAISNLTVPSASGAYTFTVKTKGTGGVLTSISTQPVVNVAPPLPLIENFEYATGSYLTANGWSAHSGAGTNSIAVNADPLTYSGYIHSGVGKSVTMTTTGEDVNRPYLTVNNGSVYASFMVKILAAPTSATGEYFFHLMPPTSTTTHVARVYFRKAVNDNIAFGISKNTPSPAPLYTDSIYAFNTTYLVVVKYTFNPEAGDDEVKLWINPDLLGTEPTANLTTTAGNDVSALGLVALRQGAGNATPALILGGVRINTNWIPSGATSKSIIMSMGWNMISIPYNVSDYRKNVLFPTAISNAFYYDASYKKTDTLKNGVGYWLKFAAAETVNVMGVDITSDSIDVVEGWNLIGSIARPVRTSDITSQPADIVKSYYFGYSNSYFPTDSVRPGKGYWVKTSSAGKLYLNSTGLLSKTELSPVELVKQLQSLTITDKNGYNQTLYFGSNADKNIDVTRYELPPVAPEGLDVRFASNRMVEVLPEKIENNKTLPISIKSSAYPITISWNVKDGSTYTLKDGASLKQSLIGEGKLVLSKPVSSLFIEVSNKGELPTEFSLSANYPNPFNPSTKFVLAVPKTAVVEIVVYDILGRKVKSLLNEEKSAGYHTIEWNGLTEENTSAPSGVYFVRMVSEKFSAVRKIMMMK